METQRDFLCVKAPGTLRYESSGDYTLPDYNTDVKRVLETKVEIVDSGCFVNGDDIDISGSVSYEVLYLDSDNELASCSFSTDFDTSLKCNGEAMVGCSAVSRVDGYSVRLVGPRRFSVKAQIATEVKISERASLTVGGSAFEYGEPEVRTKNVKVATAVFSTPVEKEYTEVITNMDGVIADDLTVLYSDCHPELSVAVTESGCEVTGVLHLRALVKKEEEIPAVLTADIDVSESVEMDDVSADMDLAATTEVSSLRISTEANEDGVTLVAKPTVEYRVCGMRNAVVPIVLDAYLTDHEVENTYTAFSQAEYLGGVKCAEELTFTPTNKDLSCEVLREIIFTDAKLRVIEATPEGFGVKIKGIIRFSGVACQINEDGTPGFVGIKYDAPFEKNVNYTCHIPASARIFCNGGVTSVGGLATADGAELTVGLSLDVSVLNSESVSCLCTSVAKEDKYDDEGVSITVYYPAEGETLYDVGRKFHTRPIDIAADNSLAEAVFAEDGGDLKCNGVKRLIIR